MRGYLTHVTCQLEAQIKSSRRTKIRGDTTQIRPIDCCNGPEEGQQHVPPQAGYGFWMLEGQQLPSVMEACDSVVSGRRVLWRGSARMQWRLPLYWWPCSEPCPAQRLETSWGRHPHATAFIFILGRRRKWQVPVTDPTLRSKIKKRLMDDEITLPDILISAILNKSKNTILNTWGLNDVVKTLKNCLAQHYQCFPQKNTHI